MTPDERKALGDYAAVVRDHYGDRLVDILVFGSRARGDAHPESDADIVVILDDGEWRFWEEKMRLAGFAYDVLLDYGLNIQAWPLPRSAWDFPAAHRKQRFIETIRADARRLTEVA